MKQLKYVLLLFIGILISCSDDDFTENTLQTNTDRGRPQALHQTLNAEIFKLEAPVLYENLLATNTISALTNNEYSRLQIMLDQVNKIEIDSLISYTFEVKHLDYPDIELTENLIYTKYYNDVEALTLLRYELFREDKQQLLNIEQIDLSRNVGIIGTSFELNTDEHLYESFNMFNPEGPGGGDCWELIDNTGFIYPGLIHTWEEVAGNLQRDDS